MSRSLIFVATALAALMAGCASLPPLEGRTATTALSDTAGTRLGRAVAADVAANPDKTGIHPLSEGPAAFATRVLFAAAAEKSIDTQYYVWHGDQVGYLLFEALWQAAERGVRVRLLLDDLNTGGLDPTIATLDAHPNIEVRLYNPLVQRGVSHRHASAQRPMRRSYACEKRLLSPGSRCVGPFASNCTRTLPSAWRATTTVTSMPSLAPRMSPVEGSADVTWTPASCAPPSAALQARSKFDGPATGTGS